MRAFRWIMGRLCLALAAPAIAIGLAAAISTAAGCAVREGAVRPCLVFGVDLGPALQQTDLAIWAQLFTLPALLIVAALWLVVELTARRRRAS